MNFLGFLRNTLVLAVIVCGTRPCALADEILTLRDTNSDGVLSGREAYGLKLLDEDGDGEISETELRTGVTAWRQKLRAAEKTIFGMLDANEDGRLSGTELVNYEFCDLNGDGRVTEQEYLVALGQRRDALAALTRDLMRQTVEQYFRQLDQNEDDRLSGNEIIGIERYDLNSDKRIILDECEQGLVLDAISGSHPAGEDLPVKPPGSLPLMPVQNSDNPIQILVQAANTQDPKELLAHLRPELNEVLDVVMLQYIVEFVHKHHGKIQPVDKSAIETRDGDEEGTKKLAANVRCEKEKLRINATVYDGKILGFKFDSEAVDLVNDELFQDLSASLGREDGLAIRFATFYSPIGEKLISNILHKKDAAAVAMFHPMVQESIGVEAFTGVFDALRAACKKSAMVEIESFLVEQDKDGDYKFLIRHRVTDGDAAEIVTTGFQIIGLKAALVSVSVAAAESTEAEPSPLQKLVKEAWEKLDREAKKPTGTDDDDVTPPPVAPTESPRLPAPPRLD